MRDKAALDDNRLFPSLLFLLTIITRNPFMSKLLYQRDSTQLWTLLWENMTCSSLIKKDQITR